MQGSEQILVDFFAGDFSTMGTIAILIRVDGDALINRVANRAANDGAHRARRMLVGRA
jgi:hypothetical protein